METIKECAFGSGERCLIGVNCTRLSNIKGRDELETIRPCLSPNLFRFLEERGFRPPRLASIHIDPNSKPLDIHAECFFEARESKGCQYLLTQSQLEEECSFVQALLGPLEDLGISRA